MSKLAFIKRYNYAPAAGGILGDLWDIGKGIFGKKKTKAPSIIPGFSAPGFPIAAPYTSPQTGAKRLMNGGGGGGIRRGKGISARELKGFRKVSRLLHREGMVPKRTRKGKGLWA
jgi:hypothetical protein